MIDRVKIRFGREKTIFISVGIGPVDVGARKCVKITKQRKKESFLFPLAQFEILREMIILN